MPRSRSTRVNVARWPASKNIGPSNVRDSVRCVPPLGGGWSAWGGGGAYVHFVPSLHARETRGKHSSDIGVSVFGGGDSCHIGEGGGCMGRAGSGLPWTLCGGPPSPVVPTSCWSTRAVGAPPDYPVCFGAGVCMLQAMAMATTTALKMQRAANVKQRDGNNKIVGQLSV